LRLVGTAIGTDAYRQEALTQSLAEYAGVLDKLSSLPAPVAFELLAKCVHARPMYLARTTPPEVAGDCFEAFDRAVEHCVLRISQFLHSDVPAHVRQLISLPECMGGLGLRSLQAVQPIAWSCSFAHAAKFLQQHLGGLLDVLRADPECVAPLMRTLRRVVPELFAGAEDALPMFWTDADPRDWPSLPRQRDLSRSLDKTTCSSLLDGLVAAGASSAAAWVRSGCYKGSGGWLHCATTTIRALQLSSSDFVQALQFRLCLGVASLADLPSGTFALCAQCSLTPDDAFGDALHGPLCLEHKICGSEDMMP